MRFIMKLLRYNISYSPLLFLPIIIRGKHMMMCRKYMYLLMLQDVTLVKDDHHVRVILLTPDDDAAGMKLDYFIHSDRASHFYYFYTASSSSSSQNSPVMDNGEVNGNISQSPSFHPVMHFVSHYFLPDSNWIGKSLGRRRRRTDNSTLAADPTTWFNIPYPPSLFSASEINQESILSISACLQNYILPHIEQFGFLQEICRFGMRPISVQLPDVCKIEEQKSISCYLLDFRAQCTHAMGRESIFHNPPHPYLLLLHISPPSSSASQPD